MAQSYLEPSLADEVLAETDSESLHFCFNCGTCTAACPISWADERYNPRRVLRQVTMGEREEVLSNPAIWLCSACDICYPRCPQKLHLSDLMKAIRNVAVREGYAPTRTPAQAIKRRCASCGLCVQTCPYGAIKLTSTWVKGRQQVVLPEVDKFLCQECGICTATCPVSAINAPDLGDEPFIAQVKKFVYENQAFETIESDWEPRIVAFLCDWCLYSKLDRADIAKVQEQPDVQVVKIPCLGRMDPMHVLAALQEGIDGVLVVGCHLGNCHYRHGNLMARNKMTVLNAVLDAAGERARVKIAHISSAERGVFPRLVKEMKEAVRALGPADEGALRDRTAARPSQQEEWHILQHSIAVAQPIG